MAIKYFPLRQQDEKIYLFNDQIEKCLLKTNLAKTAKEASDMFEHEIVRMDHYILALEQKLSGTESEKVIGLATWRMEGMPRHGLVELYHIGVLPEHQGKGIARELIRQLELDAQSLFRMVGYPLRKVYIKTHASNEGAHGLYTKCGYTHETTLRDHFAKGVDEYIFSKFFD